MKAAPFDYLRPDTVAEAVRERGQHNPGVD
jgi:hypothetical protein